MNFRDKLTEKLYKIDHSGIWWGSSQLQEHYCLIADQQIAIFKEMLDTMELPKNPYDCEHDPCYCYEVSSIEYGTDFEQEYCSGCQNDGYDHAQQDLLKAIKELLEEK